MRLPLHFNICFLKGIVVSRILCFYKVQSIKYINDCQALVDQVGHVINLFQLVYISFQDHRQEKITDHGKTDRKDHIAQVLDKEYGENAIKDKRQLDTQADPVDIVNAYK